MTDKIKTEVQQWLENVVIGLNLCPFAAKPYQQDQISIIVYDCHHDEALLEKLQFELMRLNQAPASEIETTLVIIPEMLSDFNEYNQFLNLVDELLITFGWDGQFQVASFHPNYCFSGTHFEDAENLTNRSPYPILHLIREESIEKALNHYPDSDLIPINNIKKVESLNQDEKLKLFPYLFGQSSQEK